MRVKQLGTVIFEKNNIFVNESDKPDNVMAETRMSVAGTHIVYEAQIFTPYITLNSKQYSWITAEQKLILENMWYNLGTTYTLTYENDSTDTVRMAREKKLIFTPRHEGSCDFYTVTIPLAKV